MKELDGVRVDGKSGNKALQPSAHADKPGLTQVIAKGKPRFHFWSTVRLMLPYELSATGFER